MSDLPTTPATRWFEERGVKVTVRVTEPARSAEESAEWQGIALGRLLKTIVVRKSDDEHVFVLVPGDREIDWKKLRKHLGVSRLSLPSREMAETITGYKPGTITPFGAKAGLPVILDEAAAGMELVALGGGAPGVNIHLAADELVRILGATTADVTSPR